MNKILKCLLFTSIISTSLVTASCSSSEKYTFAMGYKTTYASQNDFTSNFIQVDAVSMILDSRGIVKDIMFDSVKFTLGVNVKTDYTFIYKPIGNTVIDGEVKSYIELGELGVNNPLTKESFDKDIEKYASFCKRKTIDEIFMFKNQLPTLADINIDVTNYNDAIKNALSKETNQFKLKEIAKVGLAFSSTFGKNSEGVSASILFQGIVEDDNKIAKSFTDEIVYEVNEAQIVNSKIVFTPKDNQLSIQDKLLYSRFDLVNNISLKDQSLVSHFNELNRYDEFIINKNDESILDENILLNHYDLERLNNLTIKTFSSAK